MTVDRFSFKNSIATKLFQMVFLIYFAVTLFLTLIQMTIEYNHVRDEVFRELQSLATAVRPGLAKSLWDVDMSQVRSTINVISKLPIITGIKLEDEKENLIEARGMVFYETAITNKSSDTFYYDFSIIYGPTEKQVGKITLYSSRGVVFDRVEYGFILILVNSFFKTLALWGIFLVVSRFVLGRPLRHLIEVTRQIDLDNLEQFQVNIRRKGRDELKIFPAVRVVFPLMMPI